MRLLHFAFQVFLLLLLEWYRDEDQQNFIIIYC